VRRDVLRALEIAVEVGAVVEERGSLVGPVGRSGLLTFSATGMVIRDMFG
jgi:hypothetical protein